jgi:hypothetical protein
MSKTGLNMSEGSFKVTNTRGLVIQPLLDTVNRRTHGPKMFENPIFDVFGHG